MKGKFVKSSAIAFALVLGVFGTMPYSAFALPYEETYNETYNGEGYGEDPYEETTEYENEYGEEFPDEYDEPEVVTKDTSWFDYLNPQTTYHIENEAQLLGFASLVNEQQSDVWKPDRYEDFKGVTFILDSDIKMTGNWIPVGNDDSVSFKGVFDGNGHTISGLSVDASGGYAGFFGYLSGAVKNLTLKGKVKATGGRCGAFAGYLSETGVISGCVSHVKVSAGSETGGICGYNKGLINRTINYGNVKGTMKIGGVCGENWNKITKCGNRGTVKSTTRGYATYGTGGVAGRSLSENSLIDRCYNTGAINSRTEGTGGVTGFANVTGAKIYSSYNTGTISVKNDKGLMTQTVGYAGGIVGIIPSKSVKIIACYNAGTINNSDVSGGIIGQYNNASKNKTDNNIRDNYFVSSGIHYGIGADNTGASINISGTGTISAGALANGAATIGADYINDNNGEYGNFGYPVLVWQEVLDISERSYLSNIPVALQKKFDKYVSSSRKNKEKGYSLYIFFNHNEFSSDAMREYNNER